MKTDDKVLGLVDAFCYEKSSWGSVEAAMKRLKRESAAEDTEAGFRSCSTETSFQEVHRPWEANIMTQSIE